MTQLGPVKASTVVLPIGGLRMTAIGRKGFLVTVFTSRKSGMVSTMLTTNTGTRNRTWRKPNLRRKSAR